MREIHTMTDERTPEQQQIMLAAERGDVAAIKELVRKGSDLNATDNYGFTPLHLAAWVGIDSVIALLKSGADVNAKSNVHSFGLTPLHLAVSNKQVEIVRELLKQGADIHERIGGLRGVTSLQLAAGTARFNTASMLLEVFHDKRKVAEDETYKAILHILQNASVFSDALLDAVEQRNLESVKKLWHQGARLNTRDYGQTAFHQAAKKGFTEIVEFFLQEEEINPNIKNVAGETPLHVAARMDHVGVVEVLLKNAEAKEEQCDFQSPPIPQRIRTIVNAKIANGDTPLHIAARANCAETVGLLRAALRAEGADDTGVENNAGQKPALHAVSQLPSLLHARYRAFGNSKSQFFEPVWERRDKAKQDPVEAIAFLVDQRPPANSP